MRISIKFENSDRSNTANLVPEAEQDVLDGSAKVFDAVSPLRGLFFLRNLYSWGSYPRLHGDTSSRFLAVFETSCRTNYRNLLTILR